MMDYVLVAVGAGFVGMMFGVLGAVHYAVNNPREFMEKANESFGTQLDRRYSE